MGWASANRIFDPAAEKVLKTDLSDEVKTEILSVLIAALQEGDWDTETESLERFRDSPPAAEAFRRNGVIVICGEVAGEENWWCELEEGHGGDHDDHQGNLWPASA